MSPKSFLLQEAMANYVVDHSGGVDPVAANLIEQTANLGSVARMQIAPEQAALLTFLVRSMGVATALEIGTFTGYSALAIARGLPTNGSLTCFDISEEWSALARQSWLAAQVEDRIELRIEDASVGLQRWNGPPIEFAFVDADKGGYRRYLELLLPLLARNAIVAVDNTLWAGAVLETAPEDPDTQAIQAFNDWVRDHPGFESVLLPIADGLTLIRLRT